MNPTKVKKKLGTATEIKIKDYNCEYGTINKNECKAIFLYANTYIHPINDYKIDLDRFKHRFERYMKSIIKNELSLLKTAVITSIEQRNTNNGNVLNTRFTLLPIEVTILFSNNIEYVKHKDKFQSLLNKFIQYLMDYEDLIFSPNLYK